MFSFLLIFIFTLLGIFFLTKLINHIFSYKKRIKSKSLSFTFIVISLTLSFLFSIISFYLVLNFLVKIPDYLGINTKQQTLEAIIPATDCLPLTNAIEQTESKITGQENHRYIEETAHLFTIKLEYQKAAKKLKEQAQLYKKLTLSPESQQYTQKISDEFQKQSDLFSERTTIITNKTGIKKVYKLLEKMDRIDQERLRLINQVKQQCSEA